MDTFRSLSKKLEESLELIVYEFTINCDQNRRPIIDVEISNPREGVGIPIKTRGWIDTGADKTVIGICGRKIKDAQLIPLPKPEGENIHLANGESVDFNLYLANIKLISPDLEYNCGLIDVRVIDQKKDIETCLIGINLLEKGIFTYDGHNGQFSLAFPD